MRLTPELEAECRKMIALGTAPEMVIRFVAEIDALRAERDAALQAVKIKGESLRMCQDKVGKFREALDDLKGPIHELHCNEHDHSNPHWLCRIITKGIGGCDAQAASIQEQKK